MPQSELTDALNEFVCKGMIGHLIAKGRVNLLWITSLVQLFSMATINHMVKWLSSVVKHCKHLPHFSLYTSFPPIGFITMTPQLFINYKLKSVAHLPWRMLTYKALNTFIDDMFAFVIKMPTMY